MPLNSFTPNTRIESAKVTANFTNLSNHGRNVNLKFFFPGTPAVGDVSKDILSFPDDATLERADVHFNTAPTAANGIIDIERSADDGGTWTTIFTGGTNRPVVTAGSRAGSTSTIDVPSATALTHKYRAKIAQLGSTIAGSDVTVILRGKYDLD